MTADLVQHVAGPYLEGVQFCTRCGETLVDHRDALYLAGTSRRRSRGFIPGAPVVKGPGFVTLHAAEAAVHCGVEPS